MKKGLPLAAQLLAMQVAIVLAVLVAAGWLAFNLQQEQIRQTYAGRVLEMARSLAEQPAVREAYASDDPSAALQPLAELVRQSAGAEFVVFTDIEGVRYAHPDPAKIGARVSTDPSVALGGAEFVGTETGTLGVSLRAKVPVRDDSGRIKGRRFRSESWRASCPPIWPGCCLGWWPGSTGAAFVGVVGAIAVTRAGPASDPRPGAGGDRRAAPGPRRDAPRHPRRRGGRRRPRTVGAGQRRGHAAAGDHRGSHPAPGGGGAGSRRPARRWSGTRRTSPTAWFWSVSGSWS